jgi:peptidoglycan/LPS O-acetylase OafA/YrhL
VFHTWSLSVEEHFYLLWPLVLVVLIRRSKWAVGWVALAAALISFAAGILLYVLGADFNRLAYAPDLRSAGIFLGCAVAVWATSRSANRLFRSRRVSRLLEGAGWGALIGLLVLAAATPLGDFYFVGGFALVSVLAMVVILGASFASGSLSRILSLRPLQVIGARSYGIYLWHFPVFHFVTSERFPEFGTLVLAAVKLLLLVVLVELSWRCVERPALRARRRFARGRAARV